MKLKFARKTIEALKISKKNYYLNKYYNLFQNLFKWTGIDDKAKEFIMRQFWSVGAVACFKLKDSEGSTLWPLGMPVFTPFAVNGWDIYDYPISVNLINRKGVRFIPYTPQKVDEDVVLGWIQRNHKPIWEMIQVKIDELVEVEMVIRSNLNAQKMPYLLVGDEESEQKLSALFDKVMGDEEGLYVNVEDSSKIQLLLSNAPYIIDKLYNYRMCIENEIREFLGLDNIGVGEKKEHLISDEVESNNQVVETSKDALIDCLKEFTRRIKEVLGMNIDVEINQPEEPIKEDEEDDSEDED